MFRLDYGTLRYDDVADAILLDRNAAEIVKGEKNPKEDEIQGFLKSISSSASLPGHVKGEKFSSRRGVTNQCVVAVAVLLIAAGCGQPIGFSGVALPQLYSDNSTMIIDQEMGSWIASIHSVASPVGSMAAASLVERLGRRSSLQITTLPMIIGWIIIGTSSSYVLILIGRVFCGLAVGIIAPAIQVYVGEIAEPRLRGIISGFPILCYNVGVLIVYALGGTLSWRNTSFLCTVLPVVSLIAISMSPETPIWLAKKRKLKRATAAMIYLRGHESTALKELHQVMTAIERDKANAQNVSFWRTIKQLPVLKPFIIALTFSIVQTLSGTYTIVFYAVDIITEAAGDEINGALAACITAVIRLIAAILGSVVLYYASKRHIAIASGVGSAVSTVALGAYMWLRANEAKTETDLWVTAACLVLFITTNTVGFMMLPGQMVGELLPTKVRGICGSYIFMLFNLSVFGTTKLYPLMKANMGSHGIFLTFGICSLFGTVFLYLFLPDTRNKSLLEIEQYFQQSNFMWITRKKNITDNVHI